MIHSSQNVTFACHSDIRQPEQHKVIPIGEGNCANRGLVACPKKVEVVDSALVLKQIKCNNNCEKTNAADSPSASNDVSHVKDSPQGEIKVNADIRKLVDSVNKYSNFHVRRKVHEFPMTFVEQRRKWSAKTGASIINTDEEGELYYNPDPYKPAPPAKGAPDVITRMHYAALRVDSRKYRAQKSVAKATSHMESASCNKCNMRFFLPLNHFRSRIAYNISLEQHSLPTTFFRCPICQTESEILM